MKKVYTILLLLLATGSFLVTAAKLGTSTEDRFVSAEGSSYDDKDDDDSDEDDEVNDPQIPQLKLSVSTAGGFSVGVTKQVFVSAASAWVVASAVASPAPGKLVVAPSTPVNTVTGSSLPAIPPTAQSKAANSASPPQLGASVLPTPLAKSVPASFPPVVPPVPKPSMAVSKTAALPGVSPVAPSGSVTKQLIKPLSSFAVLPSSAPVTLVIDHGNHPFVSRRTASREDVSQSGDQELTLTRTEKVSESEGDDERKEIAEDSSSGDSLNMEGSTEIPDISKEVNENKDKTQIPSKTNKVIDNKMDEAVESTHSSVSREGKKSDKEDHNTGGARLRVKGSENDEITAGHSAKDPQDLIHNTFEKALDVFYEQQENSEKNIRKADNNEINEKARSDMGLMQKIESRQQIRVKQEKEEPSAFVGIAHRKNNPAQKPREALVMRKPEEAESSEKDKSPSPTDSSTSITKEGNDAEKSAVGKDKAEQNKPLVTPVVTIQFSPASATNVVSNPESTKEKEVKKTATQSAFKPNTAAKPQEPAKEVKEDEGLSAEEPLATETVAEILNSKQEKSRETPDQATDEHALTNQGQEYKVNEKLRDNKVQSDIKPPKPLISPQANVIHDPKEQSSLESPRQFTGGEESANNRNIGTFLEVKINLSSEPKEEANAPEKTKLAEISEDEPEDFCFEEIEDRGKRRRQRKCRRRRKQSSHLHKKRRRNRKPRKQLKRRRQQKQRNQRRQRKPRNQRKQRRHRKRRHDYSNQPQDEIFNHDGEVSMEQVTPKEYAVYEQPETLTADFRREKDGDQNEDELGEVVADDLNADEQNFEDKSKRRPHRRQRRLKNKRRKHRRQRKQRSQRKQLNRRRERKQRRQERRRKQRKRRKQRRRRKPRNQRKQRRHRKRRHDYNNQPQDEIFNHDGEVSMEQATPKEYAVYEQPETLTADFRREKDGDQNEDELGEVVADDLNADEQNFEDKSKRRPHRRQRRLKNKCRKHRRQRKQRSQRKQRRQERRRKQRKRRKQRRRRKPRNQRKQRRHRKRRHDYSNQPQDEIFNHDGEVSMEQATPKEYAVYEQPETLTVDFRREKDGDQNEDELGEVVADDLNADEQNFEDKSKRRPRRRQRRLKNKRRHKTRKHRKNRKHHKTRKQRKNSRHLKNRKHQRKNRKHQKNRRHRRLQKHHRRGRFHKQNQMAYQLMFPSDEKTEESYSEHNRENEKEEIVE